MHPIVLSELKDVFCMAGVRQLPEQSNYLAEVKLVTCYR